MLQPMTPRQFDVYEFILVSNKRNGYSPTYREIAKHFDINHKTAGEHCEALIAKGWLTKVNGVARSLQPFIIGYPESGVHVS